MSFDHFPISGHFRKAAEHNHSFVKRQETPPPFSLRLTFEEKALLRQQAGTMPLGAYIRMRLFGETATQRRSYRSPVRDDKVLAQLLGELGKARLANNLNQLAKAANSGFLDVTPETESELQAACAAVKAMRHALIAALGLEVNGPS